MVNEPPAEGTPPALWLPEILPRITKELERVSDTQVTVQRENGTAERVYQHPFGVIMDSHGVGMSNSPRPNVPIPQMDEGVGVNAVHDYQGSQAAAVEDQIRRVTIQDLEGDCRHTTLMLVPNTLSEMRLEVCRRFAYKSERCRLYTRHGAPLEHLFLIKDDELLFATDGAEFPQVMREGHLPGLEQLAQNKRTIVERYDVWGWPRVGQLIGAQNVSAKLLTSWSTNGSFASVLLVLNFLAFMFPPSPHGRGICTQSGEESVEIEEKAMRAYFWCFGLGILTSMLSLLMATTLSMQMNLLPTNRDIFWFLKVRSHLFLCILFAARAPRRPALAADA